MFNGPFSGTTQVSRYQKGKTNLYFTEARDSEWQWHQLGHMQVCILLQTDNHTSTPPLSFLQAGCPSCRPTNSVKALKATRKARQLNRIVFRCLLKVSAMTSPDHSATGKLFHATGPLTAKLLSPYVDARFNVIAVKLLIKIA